MQTPKISRLFPAICATMLCSSLMLVRAEDTPAQAAARAALMEKLSEPVPHPTSPLPVVVTASEVKVETPAPVVVAAPVMPAPVAAPVPSAPVVEPAPAPVVVAAPVADSEAPAAPPEKVLIEKIQTPPEAAPVVNQFKSPDSTIQTNSVAPVILENKPAVVAEPAVKPIETPALPISGTKEERLQALLEKYKADQITPEEYHTARAKIIGEP